MKLLAFAARAILGIVLAATILFVNDRFFFESVLVPSESMEPTLLANERAFLRRFGLGEIRRFDIVVVKRPEYKKRLVKRVVGLPGECVEWRGGWRLAVNGRDLLYRPVESSQGRALYQESEAPNGAPHLVDASLSGDPLAPTSSTLCLGPNQFLVLGDHRQASLDGRVFGAVDREQIQGRIAWVWYSFDRAQGRLRWQRLGARPDWAQKTRGPAR